MPVKFIRLKEEGPLEPIPVEGAFIKITEAIPTARASVDSYRVPSVWKFEFERNYLDAVAKLKQIVQEELKITEPDVELLLPCIVDLKDAHTKKEEERIRAAHNRFAKIFSNLVDRLVRFRPESRAFAFDALKQELIDAKPLWNPYECEKFLSKGEIDGGKGKRQAKKMS